MTRLEREFVRALQRKVIEPWRTAVRAWLGLQERWPASPDMMQAQLTAAAPLPRRALAAVLDEFCLKTANLGGQAGLEKIALAASRSGRLPEAVSDMRVGSAAEADEDETDALLLSEKLSRGVGWNDVLGGDSVVFNLRDPELLAAMRRRGEKITGDVTASMLRDLRGVLEEYGYRQGLGPHEVAAQLDAIFPATYANRAENIARTEMLVAQETTQNETYERNGVERTQWVALLDKRTRPAHAAAHGQVVGIGEHFIVGGEAMLYPGDPAASAGNICQCRCDAYPVIGDDTSLALQPWTGGYQPLAPELGARTNAAPQVTP